jgi:ketosteroid isomerase-like protein
MSVAETVRVLFEAIDAGDMDTAASYLSSDFVFSGPVPEPIGKDQWVGMQRLLLAAFPDWSFNLSGVQEQGNTATTTHQITGTHTGDLDLSMMGMPTIPATGKAIKLPVEHAQCTVEGGKVVKLHAAENPDSGVPGMLKQLGVEMPPPA